MACFDTMKTTRFITNHYISLLHRPEFMYKFKIKISGCGNDCANAMIGSDMPIIGTWRGPIQIDQAKVAEFIDEKGVEYSHRQCHYPLSDTLYLPQGQGAGGRRRGLRPLHALHQRHAQGPETRQG